MKVVNPNYKELSSVPVDIELRDKVGISLEETALEGLRPAVEKLLFDNQFSRDSLRQMKEEYIYNVGNSGKVGAEYIINRLVEMQKKG